VEECFRTKEKIERDRHNTGSPPRQRLAAKGIISCSKNNTRGDANHILKGKGGFNGGAIPPQREQQAGTRYTRGGGKGQGKNRVRTGEKKESIKTWVPSAEG